MTWQRGRIKVIGRVMLVYRAKTKLRLSLRGEGKNNYFVMEASL